LPADKTAPFRTLASSDREEPNAPEALARACASQFAEDGFAQDMVSACTRSNLTPDFADHAPEVRAQHFLDDRGGLPSFRELRGNDLHVIGAGEVGQVRETVLAEGADAGLLAARHVLVESGFLLGPKGHFLDDAVGANADVIAAAQVEQPWKCGA